MWGSRDHRYHWSFTIALLAVINVVISGCGSSHQAKGTARYRLGQVDGLIHQWEQRHGRLPPTGTDGLRVIGETISNADQIDFLLRDPWEHWLVYRVPSLTNRCRFDLYSTGPNGIDDHGEKDDIVLDDTGHRPGCPR